MFRPARDCAERAACRRQLGLPVDGIGVGFMSRLVPEKGPLLFLEALQELLPTLATEYGQRWWAGGRWPPRFVTERASKGSSTASQSSL